MVEATLVSVDSLQGPIILMFIIEILYQLPNLYALVKFHTPVLCVVHIPLGRFGLVWCKVVELKVEPKVECELSAKLNGK